MLIIWLPVLGNQKQVQDKSINGHLTGVTKKKILLTHEDNSTLQKPSIESEIIIDLFDAILTSRQMREKLQC